MQRRTSSRAIGVAGATRAKPEHRPGAAETKPLRPLADPECFGIRAHIPCTYAFGLTVDLPGPITATARADVDHSPPSRRQENLPD